MRTLLRHIASGRYFKSLEAWTTDVERAHDFKGIACAMHFAKKTGWPGLELVISLEEEEHQAGPPAMPSWVLVPRKPERPQRR